MPGSEAMAMDGVPAALGVCGVAGPPLADRGSPPPPPSDQSPVACQCPPLQEGGGGGAPLRKDPRELVGGGSQQVPREAANRSPGEGRGGGWCQDSVAPRRWSNEW